MVTWILESTVAAGLLALLAWILAKRFRHRPALLHLAWLVVMIRLVCPPLPVNLPLGFNFAHVGRWLEPRFVSEREPAPEIQNPAQASEWIDNRPGKHEPPHALNAENPAKARSGIRGGEVIQPKSIMAVQVPDEIPVYQATVVKTKAVSPSKPQQGESWQAPSAHRGRERQAIEYGSRSSLPPLKALLFWVWLCGASLVLFALSRQLFRMGRRLADLPFAGIQLLNEVTAQAKAMSVKTPSVLVGPGPMTPYVWCWGRKYLVWPERLLPPSAHQGGTEVLAHELAHLKRRDHWVIWLEWISMVVMWWHPLFWLARTRIRLYRELACDALVVDHFPRRRKQYAMALVEALRRHKPSKEWAGALAMGALHEKEFKKRLGVIMNQQTSAKKPWVGVLALILMGILLFPAVAPSPNPAPRSPLQKGISADLGFLPISVQNRIQARAALLVAKRYVKTERWTDAMQVLGPATERTPRDSELWGWYAKALRETGRYAEALSAFERQGELSVNKAWSEWGMAEVYAQSGDTASALATLEKLLHLGEIRPEKLGERPFRSLSEAPGFGKITWAALRYKSLRDEVWQVLEDKSYGQAEILLREMYEMAPESDWVWEKLGFTHFYLGDLSRAEREFQKALELGPDQSHIVYNQACVAAAQGRKERAVAYLREALEMGFDNFESLSGDPDLDPLRNHSSFKQLFQQAKMEEELGEKLKRAKKHGEPDDVLALLEQARKLTFLDDGDRRYISETLAVTRLRAGRFEASAAAFSEALAWGKGAHLKSGLYNLACALAGTGRTDDAIAALSASLAVGYRDGSHMVHDDDLAPLRVDRRFGEIVEQAGQAHLLANYDAVDWPAFQTWVRGGLQNREFDKKALSKLAKRLYSGRIWSLGAMAYEQLAELDRGSNAAYNAACCHALAGQIDDAMRWLEKAVAAGFKDHGHMLRDSDLDNLRGDARMKALMESL